MTDTCSFMGGFWFELGRCVFGFVLLLVFMLILFGIDFVCVHK